jgi:plasmid stabilization system protein ParE
VKYKVIMSPEAEADFLEIHAYLNERFGKKSEARLKAEFSRIVKGLRHTPRMFEALPERNSVHKCAALSPTLVLYKIFEQEKRVEILALYDGRYPND